MKLLYVSITIFFVALQGCKEPDTKVSGDQSENSNWSVVDSGGITSGYDTHGSIIINFNSKLYGIWHETGSGVNSRVNFGVYSDTTRAWTTLGGLNKNASDPAVYPRMSVHNSKLYATWYETAPGARSQIRVAVYNQNDSSPSWTFVDGNGATGLNYNANQWAQHPVLQSHNSKLYLAWSESDNSSNYQIRAAVYNDNDSSPAWSFVDGSGATGLNYSVLYDAILPRLVVFNTKLYLTWSESTDASGNGSGTIRVKVYNGNDSSPSWAVVDGNTAGGLNVNASALAINPNPVVFNNKLYVGWTEPALGSNGYTTHQIRMKSYNGNDSAPAWTQVDGGGYGLNTVTGYSELLTDLVVHKSQLIATMVNSGNSHYSIYMKTYNGNDSSPSWSALDGNSSAINCKGHNAGSGSSMLSFGGKLYAISSQQCPTLGEIRLQVHD
jgi:hypothetical protein